MVQTTPSSLKGAAVVWTVVISCGVSSLNELSTTPANQNGEHCFSITHPFHPLSSQTFPLLAQRFAWGEERIFFSDQETHEVRSLPLAWTNLAMPDPFLLVADGKAVLRWKDLH
jgi:hypothetical protein